MKKVAFYTLGCKLNFSETSAIIRIFEQRGYRKVAFNHSPDIFIINTCSVTENADKKCRKIVKEAKRITPDSYVVIIGCYAQLKPKEITQISGVDAVLGAAEKFQLIDFLDNFQRHSSPQAFVSPINKTLDFVHSHSIDDRTRTFLKVQDGCSYQCSFCTIPLARGLSRSNHAENILTNVKELARKGIKEVVLTGINLGDYGLVNSKRKYYFIDLLRTLNATEGIHRFRISSIEPNLLTDEIIEFVANSKKIAPHFHIPLQSGSDKILKMMRRRYLSKYYAGRIVYIKKLMPYCCIGVDVIVGFPGETDEDFLQTYRFIEQLDIAYLHVFPYSVRSDTLAAKMDRKVPEAKKRQRAKALRRLSDKKKFVFYKENIGRRATVLYENKLVDGMIHGFTENYIKVARPYDPLLINEMRQERLSTINRTGHMETYSDIHENI